MKYLIILSGLLFALHSTASTCPNISGTYVLIDNLVIKYDQVGCKTIAINYGKIDSNGIALFSGVSDAFLLDGTATCTRHGACDYAKASSSLINFSSNYNQGVSTEDHGRCRHRSYDLSLGDKGSLNIIFHVDLCADDYVGVVNKTFSRY